MVPRACASGIVRRRMPSASASWRRIPSRHRLSVPWPSASMGKSSTNTIRSSSTSSSTSSSSTSSSSTSSSSSSHSGRSAHRRRRGTMSAHRGAHRNQWQSVAISGNQWSSHHSAHRGRPSPHPDRGRVARRPSSPRACRICNSGRRRRRHCLCIRRPDWIASVSVAPLARAVTSYRR